jgi:probable O-glycosylation ligase (exosortase A-associated)
MRDVLVIAVVLGSIPFIFYRPYIGVLVYVWLSVMNPHQLAWGFAHDFQFAFIIAVVTLTSALFSPSLRRPPFSALSVLLVLFIVWTGITTMYALFPSESLDKWITLVKTFVMAFLIPMLFRTKEELRKLIWVVVVSIAYFGVKGGSWILLTGGADRVWGPPTSYIEDNNALAIAIVMIIPLMRYLQITSPHKYVRLGLVVTMLLCGVAVLGTYSRGALLAASAMVSVLWWKGGRKALFTVLAAVAIILALSYMPENWYKRMDTILNYEVDDSATARLNVWVTMFNLAKDRPVLGGGFEVAKQEVFDRYSPSTKFPPQVAHSIYFQALGEHGFVGLALYLLLYLTFWRNASALARSGKDEPDLAWARHLGRMMQVSAAGFLVGGAFLSLVNFDVPYYLMGVMMVAVALMKSESRSTASPEPSLQTLPQARGLSDDLTAGRLPGTTSVKYDAK